MNYPKKLQGTLRWAYFTQDPVDETAVPRAFLRSSNNLFVEVTYDSYVYQLDLKSNDGVVFSCAFEGRWANERSSGTATARLYSSAKRHALIGTWLEEGVTCHWWAELQEVEAFDDAG